MPTLARIGPYRFFFWSRDCEEPEHVHVERDRAVAKFWLSPVRLERSGGFRPRELRRIGRLMDERSKDFVDQWHEHCD